MKKKKLNAAVIGTGRIAGYLEDDALREHPCTHAGIYLNSPKTSLIACAGTDTEKACAYSKKFQIPNAYSNYKEMLLKENIDILSICTPGPLHYDMTLAAAKSGVKAIFLEKPMATSLWETQKMNEICSRENVILCVNHLRRWGWDYLKVRELIFNNEIGEIESVASYFSGNVMHTGTHMFDILRFMFGDVKWVSGEIASYNNESPSGYKFEKKAKEKYYDPDIFGLLEFINGTKVMINGLSKSYFIFEIDIIGSNGRIRIGNHLLELYKPTPSSHYSSFIDLHKADFPYPKEKPNPWVEALNNIIAAVQKGKKIMSTSYDAEKAMEIGFALIKSSEKNGKRITLPVRKTKKRIVAK